MRSTSIAVAAAFAFTPLSVADHKPCGEPAVLHIDMVPLVLMSMDEAVTMYFSSGGYPAVQMTFAGGTAPNDLVSAINAFTGYIGLTASYGGHGFTEVKVESVAGGFNARVTIAQAGCAAPPLVMSEPGGEPVHHMTAQGINAAPGDLDCDGVIGVGDLLILLQHWGPCPYPYAPCPADLSLDGNVGVDDLLILLANWG